MINFENMNYYLIKGKVIKDGIVSTDGFYLIETDFNNIDIYSVNIGYTKIKNAESIIIDSSTYSMNELKNYCQHLIKLETLYLNLPR